MIKQIGRPHLTITRMITDRIGLHSVLLPLRNVKYCVIKVSRLWGYGEELPLTKPVREAGGRGEGCIYPSVTFEIVVLHIEGEAMLLLVFYYFICAFLCHCRSFNPSLCHLTPFLLSCITVSRPCCLSELTLTRPH